MMELALTILYFVLSVLLLPYGYNCFFMVYASRKYGAREGEPVRNHPMVTVQLPIYNERYVAPRLIEAVCGLDWPRDRLEILVLDDSTDETSEIIDSEVEAQRSRGFDIRAVRRPERRGFKAGALQNALGLTRGRYIAVFDADHVPPADFLERTVSLLEEDGSLGFVQARWGHVNRGYSRYTEAFALAVDGFQVVEQSARSALGLLMNYTGSAGVLRTEAMRDCGGWAWDTLSEDMDLSFRMQLRGWRGTYLRDLVVPGEVPPTMPAFRNQQARWARGSTQCGRKLLRRVWLSPSLSALQKVQATLLLTYYSVSLLFFLVLLVTVPLVALGGFPDITSPVYGFLFTLCGIGSTALYYSAIRAQGLRFREKLPYMGLLALIGYGTSARCGISIIRGLFTRGGVFERVPKYNINGKADGWTGKAYQPSGDLSLLEVFFLIYSLSGLFLAVSKGVWPIVFTLWVYCMGYATVAYKMYRV